MNDVEFGEEVRRQGRPQEGASMKDLVYDPVTGEFKQVAREEAASSDNRGAVVTEMTRGGFA